MKAEACIVCGGSGPFEEHHIAGRANDPAWTVIVCRVCHRNTLTPWQWVHRIPLTEDSERSELLKSWASVTGAFHVIEALTTRLGWDSFAKSVREFEIHVYKLAGVSGVISEPNFEKLRKSPRQVFRETSITHVEAMLATMVAYLAAVLWGEGNTITLFFRNIAQNPDAFIFWYSEHDYEWSRFIKAAHTAHDAMVTFSSDMDLQKLARAFSEFLDVLQSFALSYLEDQ